MGRMLGSVLAASQVNGALKCCSGLSRWSLLRTALGPFVCQHFRMLQFAGQADKEGKIVPLQTRPFKAKI